MNDTSINARLVEIKRVPGYVTQSKDTVRVYRNQPGRLQLQLRNPRWYSTATLTVDEARQVVDALQNGIDDLVLSEEAA